MYLAGAASAYEVNCSYYRVIQLLTLRRMNFNLCSALFPPGEQGRQVGHRGQQRVLRLADQAFAADIGRSVRLHSGQLQRLPPIADPAEYRRHSPPRCTERQRQRSMAWKIRYGAGRPAATSSLETVAANHSCQPSRRTTSSSVGCQSRWSAPAASRACAATRRPPRRRQWEPVAPRSGHSPDGKSRRKPPPPPRR